MDHSDRQRTPEAGFKMGIGILRESSLPLDLGEWLRAAGRSQEAAEPIEEATAIFTRLEATAWQARIGAPAATVGSVNAILTVQWSRGQVGRVTRESFSVLHRTRAEVS